MRRQSVQSSVPGRGSSQHKGPEVSSLWSVRFSKEAGVAETSQVES